MEDERKFPDYEAKWQKFWDARKQAPSSGTEPKSDREFYVLSMFPYPSGKLHFGHALPYTLTDAMARYLRMRGYNVLNPTGWDAFGLPAENAAIENKIHPSKFTYDNIDAMRKQKHAFGYSFDWDREVFTCRPDYYKWTQWIFLQMLEKGVAYRKKARVNWCTQCHTVLANEQVETIVKDGDEFQACFRCESRVIPKEIDAWFLRITDYADRLLDGLDKLGDKWPERVVTQQRNWIGRSEGVNIDFTAKLKEQHKLTVFTTRADTVFGVTYVALAPEHPLVEQIISQSDAKQAKQLREFVKEVLSTSEQDRAGGAEKEGVNTGFKAVNPLNGEEVPIFVANYVLMYGTGAVMAVPAHDERDGEFASEYRLPVRQVIEAVGDDEVDVKEEAYTKPGKLINSGKYSALMSTEASKKIAADLLAAGKGGPKVNYKLRDWGISRQRYWGCPIPVVHCPACGIVPVPESELPVKLPDDVDFLPTGQSPLTMHPDFQKTRCPKCGRGDARRDMDTMDTFVDSSWYYLRYTDSKNAEKIFDRAKAHHWAPVDLYIGGREHAILHLIYARFYCKFLNEIGLIDFDEPFNRLYAHGLIQGESIRVVNEHMNRYVSPEEFARLKKEGKASDDDITRRIEKMSKSKKNGADPTELMNQYGADATRLAILFLGPGDADSVWDPNGMKGPYSFLKRWHDTVLQFAPLVEDLSKLPAGAAYSPAAKALRAGAHTLIDKVTREFEGRYAFNTAIAQGMALLNDVRPFVESEKLSGAAKGVTDPTLASRHALREVFEAMVQTLSPFVPHTAEELNQALGHKDSVFDRSWPKADPIAMQLDEIEIPVQVNGKLRGTIMLPREADKETMEKLALENHNVHKFVEGRKIVKLIAVPGRIVNIVAK
jgi:leucyl-tRNA synthetase